MRFYEIISERRFQHTNQMYHGTSTAFLKTILKNGLLATPPKLANPDQSLDGVYLSSKMSVSQKYAAEAVKNYGGDPMIVIVQTVLASATPDQHELIYPIFHEVWKQYLNDGYPPDEQFFAQLIKSLKEKFSLNQMSLDWIKKYVNTLKQILQKETPSKSAGSVNVYYDLRSRPELRELLNGMLNTMKPIQTDYGRYHARITRNIGYRGKTRIVKIYNLKTQQVYYQDANMASSTEN